jgi:hypothetical protein
MRQGELLIRALNDNAGIRASWVIYSVASATSALQIASYRE